jgi:precorrin-8X/cobalt-precorrin-8 methylmutase
LRSNLIIDSQDFVTAAEVALLAGGKILVDAEMVRHGIIARLFPDRERIICTLNDPRTKDVAAEIGNTRSAAAVELWRPHLAGSIAVIGNAPTALFHLLDMIDAGAPRPAAIVGLPVGFVGAAESKEQLIANPRGIRHSSRCAGGRAAPPWPRLSSTRSWEVPNERVAQHHRDRRGQI